MQACGLGGTYLVKSKPRSCGSGFFSVTGSAILAVLSEADIGARVTRATDRLGQFAGMPTEEVKGFGALDAYRSRPSSWCKFLGGLRA